MMRSIVWKFIFYAIMGLKEIVIEHISRTKSSFFKWGVSHWGVFSMEKRRFDKKWSNLSKFAPKTAIFIQNPVWFMLRVTE